MTRMNNAAPAQKLATLKAEYLRRLQREQLRRDAARSLEKFILYSKSDYIMGWFHRTVCGVIDWVISEVISLRAEQEARAQLTAEELAQLPPLRQGPRVLIEAPPQHGKSEIVSRNGPAAALGRCPDLRIISASYAQDLANSMSRDVQDIMSSNEFAEVFPDVTVRGEKRAGDDTSKSVVQQASKFDVLKYYKTTPSGVRKFKKAGRYKAAGIGAGITGHPADLIVIDDPYKDRADAESALRRDRVEKWFRAAAMTRLSSYGGIIVMCTRWRSDDLIGELKRTSEAGTGDTYKVLSFPAIAVENEPYRKIGEALHPQRFPLELLKKRRDILGPYDFASLYQQSPIPAEDSVFKYEWINFYNESTLPPIDEFDALIMSWDMAFKETNTSDFVVGQVWGRCAGKFYLLDQVRARMDFVKTLDAVKALIKKWPKAHAKLIEDKANGPAIISQIRDKVSGVIPVNPRGSKESRAMAVTPFWEAGNVYLPTPESAPWVNRFFVPELLKFPTDAHDDQVDAMTQALDYLALKSRPVHPDNAMRIRELSFRGSF